MNSALTSAPALPAMRELNTSNHLLGNPEALNAAWERDGYWFFRDVLDSGAVTRLRDTYLGVAARYGVVREGDPLGHYTGASLDNYPMRMEPLSEIAAWKTFAHDPAIHAFFKNLLGDEPFWIPTVEYRATPPAADKSKNRMDYVHQDGFYNEGFPFRICWIPLTDIDENVGGLALVEGQHNGPILHDVTNPPLFPIPSHAIPANGWCRAHYRPGDLLMMHINTPHTGLSNHADRLRLSMDIRVIGMNDPQRPTVGKLVTATADRLTLTDEKGQLHSFALTPDTYCRSLNGRKETGAEFAARAQAGAEFLVAASTSGVAHLVRDTKN